MLAFCPIVPAAGSGVPTAAVPPPSPFVCDAFDARARSAAACAAAELLPRLCAGRRRHVRACVNHNDAHDPDAAADDHDDDTGIHRDDTDAIAADDTAVADAELPAWPSAHLPWLRARVRDRDRRGGYANAAAAKSWGRRDYLGTTPGTTTTTTTTTPPQIFGTMPRTKFTTPSTTLTTPRTMGTQIARPFAPMTLKPLNLGEKR